MNSGQDDLHQAIQACYRAVRTRDVDGFVKLFASDAICHDPVGVPPYVGHTGVRAFLTGILDLTDSMDIVVTQELYAPKGAAIRSAAVTVEAVAVGKNRRVARFSAIDIITFDSACKINSLYAFWDPKPIMEILTAKAAS